MSVDFIDSNVFVYLFDETDAPKRRAAEHLIRSALTDGSGMTSFQVVQETLNVVTKKLLQPITREDAQMFLGDVLVPLWNVMPSRELYERALEIQERYRYGFYDSLIISAALKGGCKQLMSEDLHDGQVLEGLTIVNPFSQLP